MNDTTKTSILEPWLEAGREMYPELDDDDIGDLYVGAFSSDAEFAEVYGNDIEGLQRVPNYIKFCIDWQQVWDTALRHDFVEHDGHYFSSY